MATMQGAAADISSNNSDYLVCSTKEPDLESINFQESLKFFQEQVILNNSFTSLSTASTLDLSSELGCDGTNQCESHNVGNFDSVYEDIPKFLNTRPSQIHIPTVDTILESVRVLRAIQKSQEQRGLTWSLDLDLPNRDFQSIPRLINLVQKSFEENVDVPENANNKELVNMTNSRELHCKEDDEDNDARKNLILDGLTDNSMSVSENNGEALHSENLDAREVGESKLVGHPINDRYLDTKSNKEELALNKGRAFWPGSITSNEERSSCYASEVRDGNASERNVVVEENSTVLSKQQLDYDVNNAVESNVNEDSASDFSLRGIQTSPLKKFLQITFESSQSPFPDDGSYNDEEVKIELTKGNEIKMKPVGLKFEDNSQKVQSSSVKSIYEDGSSNFEYVSTVKHSCFPQKGCSEVKKDSFSQRTMNLENSGIEANNGHPRTFNECPLTHESILSSRSKNPTASHNLNDSLLIHSEGDSKLILSDNTDQQIDRLANDSEINERAFKNTNVSNKQHDFEKAGHEKAETCSVEFKTGQDPRTELKSSLREEEEIDLIREVKKCTTSSWDLVSIVNALYQVVKAPSLKVAEDTCDLERKVLLISEGATCNLKEGLYTLKLQKNVLQISEESQIYLSIPLHYLETSTSEGNVLRLDNKMGRCISLKCKRDLLKLQEYFWSYSLRNWSAECINLVNYPLKSHRNVLIIDLGSCSTRAGILMDQPTLPSLFFPSVCATNKTTGKNLYGEEALDPDVRQNSNISFPVRQSIKIIKHSIDIELVGGIFKKIFQDLRVDASEYSVQICLPRTLSINAQDALLKLLLEDFHVKSVSLTHQALLTLYAHNVSTGIVVDIGDRMDILPVVDGFIVENGVTRLPYGGQRLIHHMKHALAEKHISLSNEIDSFVVQYITENLTYVAEDYEKEIATSTKCPEMMRKSLELRSFAKDDTCAQFAVLDDARFKVPEGLFDPQLWGLDSPGVHKLVQKAIQATGVDVRKKIAENIYLSGGVTLMPGFIERLDKEVALLNRPRIIPKVIASNYRYHCNYIGACKFASIEEFPKLCVNLEEYKKNQMSSLKKFVLCF